MKRSNRWLVGLAALAAATLAGCGAEAPAESAPPDDEPAPVEPDQPLAAPSQNYGRAPEITNDVWLNTDAPIRIADQRGKVVLVEFWTFG